MAESITLEQGSGTPERVALELYLRLKSLSPEQQKKELDFYAECLEAAKDARTI